MSSIVGFPEGLEHMEMKFVANAAKFADFIAKPLQLVAGVCGAPVPQRMPN